MGGREQQAASSRRRLGTGPRIGQLRISGVLASEPAGKSLKDCQHGECYVTYDAGEEDQEVRRRFGVTGLRRLKLLRIATEAHDQGIDLTQEDLAYKVLNCGLKTIKRDIAYFRKHGLFLPTRGQQKDIGPVLAHQVEAVRLTIEGKSPWEVAKKILHTPRAIERYLATFARAVALADVGATCRDAAAQVGLSERLFGELVALRARYAGTEHEPRLLKLLEHKPEPQPPRDEAPRVRLPIYDEQVKVLRREFFDFLLEYEFRRAARYRHPLTLFAIELDEDARERTAPRTLYNRALAEVLREGLRNTDVVGRLGASRFGAVVAADPVRAYQVAERLRGLVAQQGAPPSGAGREPVRFTVSVGGASFPAEGVESLSQLTDMAETMLSQAKEAGGNRTLLHAFPDDLAAAEAGTRPGSPLPDAASEPVADRPEPPKPVQQKSA
jgi:diguanylate cyclase (GGDEF)-like protein